MPCLISKNKTLVIRVKSYGETDVKVNNFFLFDNFRASLNFLTQVETERVRKTPNLTVFLNFIFHVCLRSKRDI